MAKSRPSQRSKQPQPESKKALIIFLVFFILTTIGGGLFGYQGYIADENKAKEKQEIESKKKAAEDERDFNQYQALLYRRYLGQEKSKDVLDKLDRQFKEATEGWTQFKDRNDLLATVDAVEKRLKVVAADKGPPPKDFAKALELQVQDKNAAVAAIAPFKLNTTEPAFRYALNHDAMATEKLAEGIRAFALDAGKLEALISAA